MSKYISFPSLAFWFSLPFCVSVNVAKHFLILFHAIYLVYTQINQSFARHHCVCYPEGQTPLSLLKHKYGAYLEHLLCPLLVDQETEIYVLSEIPIINQRMTAVSTCNTLAFTSENRLKLMRLKNFPPFPADHGGCPCITWTDKIYFLSSELIFTSPKEKKTPMQHLLQANLGNFLN